MNCMMVLRQVQFEQVQRGWRPSYHFWDHSKERFVWMVVRKDKTLTSEGTQFIFLISEDFQTCVSCILSKYYRYIQFHVEVVWHWPKCKELVSGHP